MADGSTVVTSPVTVPDLLRSRAEADPDAVALLVDGDDGLTFRAWDERSNAVARGLAERGVVPGDRVALYFDNARWHDYAVCCLGVQKAGAAAVPLSPRFAALEVRRAVDHCGARALVCHRTLVPQLDGPQPFFADDLQDGAGADPFPSVVGGDDLAEILYTSGTTGAPKGVACSHESIVFFDLPDDRAPATGRRSILHAFPIGTNAGQELLRVPLRRPGLTTIALSAFDPDLAGAVVARHRVPRLQLVPAMAQVLVTSGAATRHDVSSVERITLSSAPAPPALVHRLRETFPGAAVWIAYALTESGTARTLVRCDDGWDGSVGRPVGGTEVRVVDEGGRDLPSAATGEIWLRRPGGPRRHYYRDPEATAAAFVGDWLRTGDLGYVDGDGALHLVDRAKDLIVSGGLKVSSVEVENVLFEHPAVVDAAVFAVAHEVLGQDVAAAVVVREPVEGRELQSWVRARLGEHKVPHHVAVVDRLPRNGSGKVVKRELRERFAPPPASPSSGPARRASATEVAVAAIWAGVLGVGDVGPEADFFDLGGHSIAAAQIAARVRDAFAVEVPVTAVFEWPTVAELAAAVDRLRDDAGGS